MKHQWIRGVYIGGVMASVMFPVHTMATSPSNHSPTQRAVSATGATIATPSSPAASNETVALPVAQTMTPAEITAQYAYIEAVGPNTSMAKIETAENAYQTLQRQTPKLGYGCRMASLMAVKATQVRWPHQKIGYANQSIRLFDRLERQAMASDDPQERYEFHLYRGRTYSNFPGFLNKKQAAAADLRKAAEMAPSLNRPPEELGSFYLAYALFLEKDGDLAGAKHYGRLAHDYVLSDHDAKAAKKLLDRLK
jgi:hypothetical protein